MHLPPKEKLSAIAAGVVLLGGVSYAGISRIRPDDPLRVEAISPGQKTQTSVVKPIAPDQPGTIVVDMAGEVVHTGNVTLPASARVDDAVKAAGGLKPTADADAVNLAAKLTDGEQIYVPSKNRKLSSVAPATEKKPRSRKSPKTTRAHSKASATDSRPAATAAIQDHSRPMPPLEEILARGAAAGTPLTEGEQAPEFISLNSCRQEDLMRLPGVGQVMARRIIEFRDRKGGFQSIDELLSVEGIGPKKFEKMKPYLKL